MTLELDHKAYNDRETFNLHGLPTAYDGRPYRYQITYNFDTGSVTATSRAEGNGSVRNYSFQTLSQAFDHATAWGKRKIKENQQETTA